MFDFGPGRHRRRPSLTPMIDVVFLLLVFFMLASRFGAEGGLKLSAAIPGQGAAWSGPPRLVDVGPAGEIHLNGVALAPGSLVAALAPLLASPDDPVVLRARGGASLQDLVTTADRLRAAGIRQLILAK